MNITMNSVKDWVNAHPKTKYTISAAEGAILGVLGNYGMAVATGSETMSATNLKKAIAMAMSGAFIAIYNLWKQKPVTQDKAPTP